MPQGTVTVKLRPIRLGFLVEPSDSKSILEAIKLNTFYWGGVYNPIIPAIKRLPKIWASKPFRSGKAKEILSGYLEAYDPDFLVPMGKVSVQGVNVGNREVIQPSELLDGLQDDGTPRYGIGLFEILRYFIGKELKFVRKVPLDIVIPKLTKPYEVAFSAIFGALPEKAHDIFSKFYARQIEAKDSPCGLDNYAKILEPEKLFFRRFSSLYARPISSGGGSRDQCVFYFDGTNNFDVIDYWNLRAIGWNVIPVLKQSSEVDAVKTMVANFIEANHVPYRHNPQMYYYTSILKGRSVSENELKAFVSSLKIEKTKKERETKYVMQMWYPRIWDEWARDKDGVASCDLEAATERHDIAASLQDFSVRTLDPKFINPYGGHGEPRFVNEVGIRFYGGDEISAEVIPDGDDNLVKAIGRYSFREWRFSKKGMMFLSKHTKWQIGLQVPKADEVFLAWLKYQKIEAEVSDGGLIAKQMIKCLGGTWGISILAHEGVIRLLERMSFQKPLNKKILFDEVAKMSQQRIIPRDATWLVKGFVESKMIQLGITVQCDTCKRYSWYSVKEADDKLQCGKCNAHFILPSHFPDDIEWSYRTFGPFSLPAQGQGVYAVLLTLRFFSQIMDASTTTIPGFQMKEEGKDKEVDLGLFFRKSLFGNSNTELVFVECKTYKRFEEKDAKRMNFLASKFPGAILAFATLNKELNAKEKRILSKVANRGRRYWKAERPYNPVLILTGNELFADMSISHTWQQLGGLHKEFSDYMRTKDILELCDATQQIYLGLKSWHESWRERWERRRQRRTVVTPTQPGVA